MARPSKRLVSVIAGILVAGAAGIFLLRGAASENAPFAVAHRGRLVVTLTESGVLRAAESVTYRSPVEGRELEITYLAPEGAEVHAGDLLVRLDATALKAELERSQQALREAEVELQAAEVDRRQAELSLDAVTEGAGALAVDEARTTLRLAEAKAVRLREAHTGLKPLLEKGYITRDELDRSALDLDEAEAAAHLAERKLRVLVERTQPGEQQAVRLQLSRRAAEVEHLRPKVAQAQSYTAAVAAAIEGCAIYARSPGLVVHEDNLFVTPRRKVRAGDRVTPSQGLVTLPDLRQMLVESSVREPDVHLVAPGQRARVRVDAFPGGQLSGVVSRIGPLSRATGDQAPDEKRFSVTVRLDPTPTSLRPDMTVRLDILAADRADVLLVPLSALFTIDGVPTCYVLRGASVEARIVQVGASNDSDIEIVTGLGSGERVALSDRSANH